MSVNIKDARRTVVAQPDWYPKPDGTERAVVFQPGYNSDVTGNPRADYGVHGMEISWYLRGPNGCVYLTFAVLDWVPGQLSPGHGLPPPGYPRREPEQHPHGFGMRWCTPAPQYDGQGRWQEDCPLIGVPCYFDTWFSGADEPARQFTELGEPVIWEALRRRYEELAWDGSGSSR